MSSELIELTEFLHHPNPPIRTVALENLVGFCQGPHKSVFAHDNYRPVKDLKLLARDKGKTTVQQSLTILVNLCSDEAVRELVVKDDLFMKHLVSIILDLENRNADLACILLTNASKHEDTKKVLDYEVTPANKEVFKSNKAIDCLVDAFVKGSGKTLNKMANFDYLAYFFADISRFVEGRKYFVTEQEYDGVVPLTKLLVFTEKYDSKTRREGVASTIKNSLFEVEAHMSLLDESSANLLPYILLPITSAKDAELDEDELFNLPDELQLLPEEKTRDPLPEIQAVHLESLLLLSTTREARDYLRSKSVYPLIRELHKNNDNEEVQELCDRLVQMLMRDEASSERIEEVLPSKEELGDDEEPENEKVKAIDDEDPESDGDDQIVEVV